ncbi:MULTISPECIES: hypothetical protein [Methylobacterium]|uniref:DUF6894 domain-containing protein n=1 Tax=Methylobacterium jeotgali TaxID=381630 RepID=A0ABQ4STN3_9HYPH|nr:MULTISPECIES: hypothetical protein [Methylobacterium]PIU08096.1 MAG: hypothetical protein COT56_02685 [Methylobacterium sp. CG09_land_8_20_14_0_10_71_15]PIU15550.1 MAG: hypothetical protein COT28_04010 [Methylobacterium sp. CG08_land_8_20_14_0_20_71_15]GBU17574.1 hypothetical protein AwMethylo_17890 [Methylobacterium sp.]GJE05031.1 hypothetical protein AOPFMNJM_0326 [Methylobacterium jeotgali]
MPRYFFHTHIGDDVVVDPDGRELESPDAAWEAARVLAVQLLQGADSDPDLLKAVLFVENEEQEVVLEFALTEALIAEPVPDPEGGTLH